MNEVYWSPGITLEIVEKQVIVKALHFFSGNKSRTAKSLGICPRTLDNKLAIYAAKNAPPLAARKKQTN